MEYCPGIYLGGLSKATRVLSQHRRRPGCDSNQASPEYKYRAVSLHQSSRWDGNMGINRACQRWGGAPASLKYGAPTPLRKPYKYVNIFNKYIKNRILYQTNIDERPLEDERRDSVSGSLSADIQQRYTPYCSQRGSRRGEGEKNPYANQESNPGYPVHSQPPYWAFACT
jgi:hypothetical protein